MDGPQDLGGRQGFGPVDAAEPEEPFHADWEGRMWGIARGMARPADWSIDWFRHCRELIDPADYLSRPYFDQWMQAYAAMLVDSGVVSVEEIVAGRAAGPPPRRGRARGARRSGSGRRHPSARPSWGPPGGHCARLHGAREAWRRVYSREVGQHHLWA